MKTDSIFYNLFRSCPSIFFELINRAPDEANSYQFTSREIKQTSFRLDGLFLPTTDDSDKPFYAVEVQFQPDENLYYRLFGELFLFLRQYQPRHPWRVVVIYPTRSMEREQTFQFGEILSLDRVQRIYLDELSAAAANSLGVGVVKLVIESEKTAPQMAKRLIAQAKEELTDETTKRDLIDLIETIIVYKLPQKSREEIETMLGLAELKQTKVYQEAFAEGEQRGKQEGKQEGQQEGKQEGKLEAIPRLIELGLRQEAIAEALDLPFDIVAQTAQLFHQQNVTAFRELLNNQRGLFSPEDLVALAELIAPLPDNLEELSKAITQWCRQPSNGAQFKALKSILKSLSSGAVDKLLGRNTDVVNSDDEVVNKQILLVAIEG